MSFSSSEYWHSGLRDESGVWPADVELKTYCEDLQYDLRVVGDKLDSICEFLPLYQQNSDVELRYGQKVSIRIMYLSNDTLHISVLDINLHNGAQSERCAFILKKSVVGVWQISPEPLDPSRLPYPAYDKQTNQNIAAASCQQAFRMCVVPAILYEKTLFQKLDATRNDQKMETQKAAASAAAADLRQQSDRHGWLMGNLPKRLRKRLQNFIKNGPKKN